MATDIATLEEKYIESCRRHCILPNTAILSGFLKAEIKRSRHEKCIMEILLDQLKDVDFHPLLDICKEVDASEIEAVDVHMRSSCAFEEDYALLLMRAINQKLRVVHLQDSFGKDFLRDLGQNGLTCKVLNLRSLHFRKLNMVGEFTQLGTLILDHNRFITGLEEDCFSCMPNLSSLSMCDTQISNLWTTTAALSKLPSLEELKLQNWQCCSDTGPSRSSSSGGDDEDDFSEPNSFIGTDFSEYFERINHSLDAEEALGSMFSLDSVVNDQDFHSLAEDSSDDGEMYLSSQVHEHNDADLPFAMTPELNGEVYMQEKISVGTLFRQVGNVELKYISSKASPICFKKHYRMYMIASLPLLKVLDNLCIRKSERESASEAFSENFEYLPYRRKKKVSIVSVLQKRETRSSHSGFKNSKTKSQYFYKRSLCAAKMASSAWPLLHSLPILGRNMGDENRRFSPRQFEYHPSNPSLMVFGTLDGEVVVINHENGKIVNYIPSLGALNSVLGLCWLKMYPSKLIAGSGNGSLKLYDVQKAPQTLASTYRGSGSVTFDEFDQLTSVHVNSTDELFLASGYSKDVALYDIGSATRLQDVKLWDLRQKPIRPCYTASSTKGNVMVCFSPDDQYLLASAVDNEVRQLLTADGRLHLDFEITPTGSSQNYTRSYYLNGRDYIISGSCDENLIRVCCAQTGRRLRDISLEVMDANFPCSREHIRGCESGFGNQLLADFQIFEGKGSDMSMLFVQSLRGDPFRDFNMSVLAAYTRPSSKSEIVKVNLLASRDSTKRNPSSHHSCSSNRMGG